ncbi:lysozyme family protein [Terrihalobacillus insolitus]|uniref:lysozyme family protein n=1 Tax=Terrihalobacillus insolitus TaxID=2950438 RepID=UPI0023422103|nr:lysozyme family protein [Terrihalobacillus insolitus]MDC3413138.1 lysozyme family protein [Terrihalobacillus insolitus]
MRKTSIYRKKARKLLKGVTTIVLVSVTVISIALILGNLEKYSEDDNQSMRLTNKVKSYEPMIAKELKSQGKEEYTALLLALMMQESGGRGNDPMQASESYCGEVGCIDNPSLSIKQGVDYFLKVLDKANGDIQLALQSYNFGLGFVDYVNERGGKYTEELAIEFSAMMYDRLAGTNVYTCKREEAKQYNACYGDIKYVESVLDYYPVAKAATKQKDKQIVALKD